MQQIPIQPTPNQTLNCVIGGQNCTIVLSQKSEGIFVDVLVDNTRVVSNVLAHDAVPLVCRTYDGFIGNLTFVDTQGNVDPEYSGLGSRYALIYLSAEEYALVQQ